MLRVAANHDAGTVTFSVRVQPRASKDEIAGAIDGAIKMRLRAPAIEDRANESLVAFLAEVLNTSKAAVRILSGAQPNKTRRNPRRERRAGAAIIAARGVSEKVKASAI